MAVISRRALYWFRAPGRIVVGGYAFSRLVFRAFGGVEFDASSIPGFWQFMDPALLRADALRTLYWCHAQPPAFNAMLALTQKVCGDSTAGCLDVGFLFTGLVLHCVLFSLMLRLLVPSSWAVGVTLVFAFTPASILFENWFFYTHPVACALALSGLFLHRTIDRGAPPRDVILFSLLLASIVLTRSLFHLIWLLAVVALFGCAASTSWRRVAACSVVPVLVCVATYAKNAIEFGTFSTSSWLGMSLARLAVEPLPLAERERMVELGELSWVSTVEPYSALEEYPVEWRRVESWVIDHPVLRDARKSTQGINLNHAAYLEISRSYFNDSLRLLVRRPDVYLASVGAAWMTFIQPPSIYNWLHANRQRIESYDAAWNRWFYGFSEGGCSTGINEGPRVAVTCLNTLGKVWVIFAAVVVAAAFFLGVRELRRAGGDPALGACLVFCSGTTLWVALVGNALELGENNRFRYMVEPLVLAQMAWFVAAVARGRVGEY